MFKRRTLSYTNPVTLLLHVPSYDLRTPAPKMLVIPSKAGWLQRCSPFLCTSTTSTCKIGADQDVNPCMDQHPTRSNSKRFVPMMGVFCRQYVLGVCSLQRYIIGGLFSPTPQWDCFVPTIAQLLGGEDS